MQIIAGKYILHVVIVLFIFLFFSYKILTKTKYADKVKDNRLLMGYVSTLEWITRLVPPFLLLILFVTPFDVMSILIWLVCGCAAVVSLTSLFKNRDIKSRVRPALTIVIFFSAAIYMYYHSASVQNEIDNLARDTASVVQATCNSEGVCPESPPGWQRDHDRVCTRVEFMSACNTRYEDNLKFFIRVRHSMENKLLIRGGVNFALQEELVLD